MHPDNSQPTHQLSSGSWANPAFGQALSQVNALARNVETNPPPSLRTGTDSDWASDSKVSSEPCAKQKLRIVFTPTRFDFIMPAQNQREPRVSKRFFPRPKAAAYDCAPERASGTSRPARLAPQPFGATITSMFLFRNARTMSGGAPLSVIIVSMISRSQSVESDWRPNFE